MYGYNASEDFAGVGTGRLVHATPSEAQQNAVRIISEVLGIPPPVEYSKQAYWQYISQHMAESKERSRRRYHANRSRRSQDPIRQRLRAQKEGDWEATHIDSEVFAQRVLDGESMPPSWVHLRPDAYRQQLRSLGYKSSLEEELERERVRNSGWSGLEGDYW